MIQAEITCCKCHVIYWITEEHRDDLVKSKNTFYCPNGHPQVYTGMSDKQKLEAMRKEKERVEQDLEDEVDRTYHLDMSNRGLKGNIAKMKKKLAKDSTKEVKK